MKYILISDWSKDGFIKQVQDLLDAGWKLHDTARVDGDRFYISLVCEETSEEFTQRITPKKSKGKKNV